MQQVDEAVNEYPCERTFVAIGEQSEDFKQSMVKSVESGLNCTVQASEILVRPSKAGKYASIKIGPMRVAHAGEVVAVYQSMKSDERMKFFF